jgi:hypothetical protein
MSTAFAVAEGTLFADPNLSVAGAFSAPPGLLNVPVRVILHRHDERLLDFGDGAGARNPGVKADLLVREVPTKPRVGVDTLTVGGTLYQIRDVNQTTDPDALTWQCDLGV